MNGFIWDSMKQIVERVEQAEKMAQPGSPEHYRYVAAALVNEWPKMRAMFASYRQAAPSSSPTANTSAPN